MSGFKVGDKVRRKNGCQSYSWSQLMASLGRSPDSMFTVSKINSDELFQVDVGHWFYSKFFEVVTPKRQKKYL